MDFLVKNRIFFYKNTFFILKKDWEYDKITVYAIHVRSFYIMRKINKVFLTGCGYAVLILTLFYAFAAISKFVSQSIAPGQFALILTFSFVISFAELLYEELKIKKVYKCFIHYAVLLVAFCLIFVISGNISSQRPSAVFVAIIVYTVLYFTIWAIVHFVRKAINKADIKLESRTNKADAKAGKSGKKPYKSIYSDED